jgi:hypothetical protein
MLSLLLDTEAGEISDCELGAVRSPVFEQCTVSGPRILAVSECIITGLAWYTTSIVGHEERHLSSEKQAFGFGVWVARVQD